MLKQIFQAHIFSETWGLILELICVFNPRGPKNSGKTYYLAGRNKGMYGVWQIFLRCFVGEVSGENSKAGLKLHVE